MNVMKLFKWGKPYGPLKMRQIQRYRGQLFWLGPHIIYHIYHSACHWQQWHDSISETFLLLQGTKQPCIEDLKICK